MHVEPSRHPERYAMSWPGMPLGLSYDQARNYWIQHRKPFSYQLERFAYNPKTGQCDTVGFDLQKS